jgi:hypothetical protein
MDWTTAIDAYCERTGPAFWAEPVNALTNLGFVLVAIWLWRRSAGIRAARVLAAVLAAIGVGSFLFHTYAQTWAGVADVVPIALFVLIYVYLVHRDFLRLPVWAAGLAVLLFLPYAVVVEFFVAGVPFLAISGIYWAIPLALFAYAAGLMHRNPAVARGLALGAALLTLSIVLRSVDEPWCNSVPLGTHFAWHLINAAMLGWMIELYRRHRTGHGGA